MSLVARRKVSKDQINANRQNALKSTGPQTAQGKRRSRLNALRHGLSAKFFRQVMLALDEDPREFDRLHRDLIHSLAPANGLEAKLVDDLARLWWKKARAERAQSGVQLREVERMHLDRMRELHEVNRVSLDESQEEVLEVGLRRAKDCTGKFEEALSLLELLIARVERRVGYEDAELALKALYGKRPTWRGSLILELFQQLRESPEVEPEAERDEGAAPEEPPDGASSRASLRAGLLQLLLEDSRDLTEEQEIYLREHVEISPATRDARLAPTDSRWTWMLRLDNSLDRQIDRKLRMLMKVQSLRRKPSRCGQETGNGPGTAREREKKRC